MRTSSIAFTIAALFLAAPAARAQHQDHQPNPSEGSHDMAMMMEHHHSAAAVDLLLAHRDSLALTAEQVSSLVELKERFAGHEGHAMHQEDMGCSTERGVMLDRVPGKSVPRSWSRHEHDPMCPMASLDMSQRRMAHELLEQDMHHRMHQGMSH